MAISRQAVSGKAPDRSRVCIKPEDLESFTLLLELGTKTSYWKMLLGAFYAAMSLAQLLPLTFSLLFGATKGAGISKTVMPSSRVPDVISSAAAVFTFPFIFQLAVLIQNTVGSIWTLIGIFLMLIGIFTKMNPRLMRAYAEPEIGDDGNPTDEDMERSKLKVSLKSKRSDQYVAEQPDGQLLAIGDENARTKFDVVYDADRKVFSLKGVAKVGPSLLTGDGEQIKFMKETLLSKIHLKTQCDGQYVVENDAAQVIISHPDVDTVSKLEVEFHESSHLEDFKRTKKRLEKATKVTLALALVMFGVSVITNGTLQAMYRLLEKQDIQFSNEDKKDLGQQFVWTVVRMVCTVLGKSLVSTVFFADGIVDIMHRFHWGEDNDDLEVQCDRMRLVQDLHTLFPHRKVQSVQAAAEQPAAWSSQSDLEPQAVHPATKETNETVIKAAQLLMEPNASGGPIPKPKSSTQRDARTVLQWIARRQGKTTPHVRCHETQH